jgi:hypothetical protein
MRRCGIKRPYGFFREVLSKRGVIEKLFALYRAHLEKITLIENHTSTVDTSFVEAAAGE